MTATARLTPVGTPLTNPFPCKIAIAADPDVSLWEVSVTPPGLDGGEKIDTTTMWNLILRTFAPRTLKTLTPVQFTAAYDPAVYDQLTALINVNGWITVHLPDGSGVNFVGFLKSVAPAELADGGGQPRVTCVIEPTNQIAGVEQDVEYSATGTGT